LVKIFENDDHNLRSREGCIKMLKEGQLIGVAPGGGFEAQLGTNNYEVEKYTITVIKII